MPRGFVDSTTPPLNPARRCRDLAQIDVVTVEELRGLPGGERLVILAGTRARLDYATQSRLGLEAIHPGRPVESNNLNKEY